MSKFNEIVNTIGKTTNKINKTMNKINKQWVKLIKNDYNEKKILKLIKN